MVLKSGSLNLLEPSGSVQGLLFLLIFLLAILSSMPVACLRTKLTPHSRLILDILTLGHVVNKFSPFYENQTFITVFTKVRHLSMYWARLIQYTSSDPFCCINILILSPHLCIIPPSVVFLAGFFSNNKLYKFFSFPMRATCPTHPHLCYHFNKIW